MTEPPMDSKMETLLWMIVFLGMVGFGSYIANRLSPTPDTVGRVNVIIVLATGLVLIWYTVETRRLRAEAQKQVRETQRQIEIQQRPFVIFEVFRSDENRERFIPTLTNIGNGIALNVRLKEEIVVKEIPIIDGETWGEYIDAYSFIYSSGEHILQKGAKLSIENGKWQILSINENFSLTPKRFMLLYTQGSNTYYKARIEFQNIEMDRYYVEQENNPEGLFIINSGRLYE